MPKYKKSSGFKMKGSPHKAGDIEGTSGHASALKNIDGTTQATAAVFDALDKMRAEQGGESNTNQGGFAEIAEPIVGNIQEPPVEKPVDTIQTQSGKEWINPETGEGVEAGVDERARAKEKQDKLAAIREKMSFGGISGMGV